MKDLILLVLMALSLSVDAQNKKQLDSLKKECSEIGRNLEEYGTITLAYCPPYKKDYPDSTVLITPVFNGTASCHLGRDKQ